MLLLIILLKKLNIIHIFISFRYLIISAIYYTALIFVFIFINIVVLKNQMPFYHLMIFIVYLIGVGKIFKK